MPLASKRTGSHLSSIPARQTGISLIPVVITIFIFTLLITQVIIPGQMRSMHESDVQAAANSVDKLIQASLAFRADKDDNGLPRTNWPKYIDNKDDKDDLVPKYLPFYNNHTPWGGKWQIIGYDQSGAQVASTKTYHHIVFETDTGNSATARELVRKIGSNTQIVDATKVRVSLVTLGTHFIENLTVGNLRARDIEESSTLTFSHTTPFIPTGESRQTVDKLIVTTSLEVHGKVTNNLVVDGTLRAKNIVEGDGGGSSKIYKKNIQPLEIETDKIYQLQAVSFDYKPAYTSYQKNPPGSRQLGLIAEQVDAIVPELAIRQGGQIVNVDYEKLAVLLLPTVQQLRTDLTALQAENKRLAQQLQALQQTQRTMSINPAID